MNIFYNKTDKFSIEESDKLIVKQSEEINLKCANKIKYLRNNKLEVKEINKSLKKKSKESKTPRVHFKAKLNNQKFETQASDRYEIEEFFDPMSEPSYLSSLLKM